MQWYNIYKEISPLFTLYNDNLRLIIIVIVAGILLVTAFILRTMHKRNINFKLSFIHALPILIFSYFLINGLYQTYRSPRAYEGIIEKKYYKSSRKEPFVKLKTSSLIYFNERGIDKTEAINKTLHLKTTPELYEKLPLKKKIYIIIIGDGTALSAVLNNKVISPTPHFLREPKK